jgi:hypothetical protein
MKLFTSRSDSAVAGRQRKPWIALSLLVVVLLVIGSMGIGIISNLRSSSTDSSYYANEISSPPVQDSAGKSANDTRYGSGVAAPGATTAAAATTTAAAGAPSSAKGGTTSSTSSNYNLNSQTDRMVIRSASLSLITEDVEKTLANVRSLVTVQQGFVVSSNSSVRGDYTYATIVVQIPAPAYDETMNLLRKSVYKVESESSTSQDVTEEFVDTDAQVRNLKVTEAQLLDLMKKATSLNDTLTLQRELTNIRGEIERREGRLNFLSKKTAYSTISISISPKTAPPVAVKTQDWDFGQVVDKAWAGSLKGLQGLATVSVNVAVYAIWLVPLLALMFFLIVFSFRRLFPRRPQTPGSGMTPPPASPDPSGQGAAA